MKKISLQKKRKKRTVVEEWDLSFNIESHEKQLSNIQKLYLHNTCDNVDIFTSQLKQKLNGYKKQDEVKLRLNKDKFMDMDTLVELLVASKLKCHYCKDKLYVLYDKMYDRTQWTLDRIDNGIGHNGDNCVVSCLKCNVQRRVMDDEKFRFTKQMKICKVENEDNIKDTTRKTIKQTNTSHKTIRVTNTQNYKITKKE